VKATVREIDGQLVLDDPDALAVVRVAAKRNCRGTLELNNDRVRHFQQRVVDLGRSAADTVIVLLNVNDPNGGALADILMPGHDWQAYRDRGEVPLARGLAVREGIQTALDLLDREAADKLRASETVVVVVVDHGVAEVFDADEAWR
jgi:hypothetical protein